MAPAGDPRTTPKTEGMTIHGQLVGADGGGGALLEELVYDDEKGQLLTTTFMDYLIQTVMAMLEATAVRILEETATPLNPSA